MRVTLDEIRAEWDAEADTFNQEPDHGLTYPATRAWWQLLADVLPPAPAKIADLGSGTGSISVLMAQHGYTVTGVDLSARMVERATAKAALNNVTIPFSVAEAASPDLPPGGLRTREVTDSVPRDLGAALVCFRLHTGVRCGRSARHRPR